MWNVPPKTLLKEKEKGHPIGEIRFDHLFYLFATIDCKVN